MQIKEKCAVCHVSMRTPLVFCCNNAVHIDCAQLLTKCPDCRQQISDHKKASFEILIKKIYQKLKPDLKEREKTQAFARQSLNRTIANINKLPRLRKIWNSAKSLKHNEQRAKLRTKKVMKIPKSLFK